MVPEQKGSFSVWKILVIAFAVLVLFRIIIINRVLFIIVISLIVTGGVAYLIYRWYSRRRIRKNFGRSVEGKLMTRINLCENHIGSLKKEISDIELSIKQLKDQLDQSFEIREKTREKTNELIHSLENEKRLREVKISFYETCKKKLLNLQHQQRLSASLSEKTRELKKLREKDYDSVAELESIKSELAYEEGFFETIDNLNLRLMNTDTVPATENLLEELEKITREL